MNAFKSTFNLTPDTMKRLTVQFKVFLLDREKIHTLLGDYVADYRSFTGTALARHEYLREKYATRAPNLTHLVFDADGELYWGTGDMAILLGRDSTTVTRMMRKISSLHGWRSRLYELRKSSGSGVYVYKKEIFDFIIDFYEEEYLQRFVAPRRGKSVDEEEKAEIYRFWSTLKLRAQNDREELLRDGAIDSSGLPESPNPPNSPQSLPELPPLELREVLRLIVARMWNVKMGALFTILFAFCYELSRRWGFLTLWVPVFFVSVLVACVLGIRRGKFNPDHLANIGAGSLLFCFLWFVGLAANDGVIHTPRGPLTAPSASEHKVVMDSLLSGGNESVGFNIGVEDIQQVKEIFYRVEPDAEYRSTGPMPQTNPATGLPYPNLHIPSDKKRGIMKIDVKYTDFDDTERGPYGFTFDLDRLFLDATKQTLSDDTRAYPGFWFNADAERDFTRIRLNPYTFNELARAGIETIRYGLNKETPDSEWPPDEMEVTTGKDLRYISAQVVFKDGTFTDVKKFDGFW
jgi:hypothetical protein